MVMAKKNQLSDLVMGKSFCFAGTWAIAVTSLKETICTAVIIIKI